MKCNVCHKDYSNPLRLWRVKGYSTFEITADVFTAETLQLILEYARINQLPELMIDTYQPESTPCVGCQLLNLKQRKLRNKLLEKPENGHLDSNEFF